MTTVAPTTTITLLKNIPAALRDELGIAAADDDAGDVLFVEHDVAVRLVTNGYAAFTDPTATKRGTMGQRWLRATKPTLDFPSIAAGAVQSLPTPVVGAKVGEPVALTAPAGLNASLVYGATVTAANTVTIKVANPTGAAIDPAAGAWTVQVVNKIRR